MWNWFEVRLQFQLKWAMALHVPIQEYIHIWNWMQTVMLSCRIKPWISCAFSTSTPFTSLLNSLVLIFCTISVFWKETVLHEQFVGRFYQLQHYTWFGEGVIMHILLRSTSPHAHGQFVINLATCCSKCLASFSSVSFLRCWTVASKDEQIKTRGYGASGWADSSGTRHCRVDP